MSDSSMYSDGTYLQHNPNWHAEHSEWKAHQVLQILSRNRIEPATLVEVGCGAGEILRTLSQHFGPSARLHGYDISPQAYKLCSPKQTEYLRFTLADLLAEDVPPADVAMAIDVFEHVEEYRTFLQCFRAKARYKVFHIPLDLSVQTVLRAAPLNTLRRNMGHIHFFTKEMALAVLEETGYEVLDWFYTQGSLQLPPTSWKAALVRLPRKLLFRLSPDWAVRVCGGFSLMVLTR